MLTCPRCAANLRTTRAFGVGSRFRCPQCAHEFAVGPRDAPAAEGKPGGWLLLAGVVGLALLLLAGAGAALAWHFWPRTDAPAVAQGEPVTAAASSDKTDPPKSLPVPIDLPSGPEPAGQAWLPPEQQERVNDAIDRGVEFLKKKQTGGGTWAFDHQTGLAALPALTLLECGVPADDAHVQKAARFVRNSVPTLTKTYELALAVLFLDRLGDPADEPLIHTMALRLMAGQKATGGWNYDCPILKEEDEQSLAKVLEATRPRSSLDLTAGKTAGDRGIDGLFAGRPGDRPPTTPPQGAVPPLTPPGPSEEEMLEARRVYNGLSPTLKGIPALRPPDDDRMPGRDDTDNSNTQFATLGLWAAGRHGAPMQRSLALLARRFQVSQAFSGGWDYNYQPHAGSGERPAMTAAGLLGLAVGHGVTADLKGADAGAGGEDAQVEKGMTALARYVGVPRPDGLYFLWSVERVGVLYGRREIGGKEWYPWGVDFLLKEQEEKGSWRNGGYPEATPLVNTCFALLFLKRANLAQDLSSKVQFLTQIKKP